MQGVYNQAARADSDCFDLEAALAQAFELEEDDLEPPAKRQHVAAEQASGVGEPPRSLLALSEPLLLRVLCFLCPDDLLAASCTCRQMQVAASDCAIWRRLYHSRWPEGPLQEDAEHVQGVTWKTLYMERDERVVAEARHTAPSQELLPIYTQMAAAKRSEALRNVESLFRSPASSRSQQLSSKVDAFRRQRGLLDDKKHASHCCRGGCNWVQLDQDTFICENSGFVHVCSQSCTFLEPDPSSDMHVCTITGRCFAAMLTEREEHAGEWERGRSRGGHGGEEGEDAGDDAADEGFSGRLGRAFAAGYHCESAAAFFRLTGRII